MREPGFYWVDHEGFVQVAEWLPPDPETGRPGEWWLVGDDVTRGNDEVWALSEKLEPPL